MEDRDFSKGASVTYAVMSLAVRLVAAQSSVFSLWFSRRAYERSRGEMITMLYEKTLNRKILSVRKNVPAEELPEVDSEESDEENMNGGLKHQEGWQSYPSLLWRKVHVCLTAPFRSKKRNVVHEDLKQPASMGKILNLMRSVVTALLEAFCLLCSIETTFMRLHRGIDIVPRLGCNTNAWPLDSGNSRDL